MQKLQSLRLTAFAAAWAEQQKNPEVNQLSFDERLGMLVDAEVLARENARLVRLLRDAKLRMSNACLEDIDFSPKRELDKTVVRQLGNCRWVSEHQNVLVTGRREPGRPTWLALSRSRRAEEGTEPSTGACRVSSKS